MMSLIPFPVDALPKLIQIGGPPEYFSTEVDEAGHEVTRKFNRRMNGIDTAHSFLVRVCILNPRLWKK
jgi:hypothetical protein